MRSTCTLFSVLHLSRTYHCCVVKVKSNRYLTNCNSSRRQVISLINDTLIIHCCHYVTGTIEVMQLGTMNFHNYEAQPHAPPSPLTYHLLLSHLVLFEIELLGFVDYSAAEDLESASSDQQQHITFEQRLAAANSEREVGNDFFQQNMIGKAVGKYLKVERLLKLS